MTTVAIAAKWRARSWSDLGAPPAAALGLAVSLSYGAVLATRWQPLATTIFALAWLTLPAWAAARAVVRPVLALAFGYAATMLGVCGVQTATGVRASLPAGSGHPSFGEHPVTVIAGFPWQGVEGTGPSPLAMDRVPFDMGVDALLVNLTACTFVAWLLLPNVAAGGLGIAGACAAVAGIAGGWQLVLLFD